MGKAQRRIIVLGKQRDFDEERWKHFITALAYAIHEQRKAEEAEASTARTNDTEASS